MAQLLRHSLAPYEPTLVPMLVAVIESDSTALRMPSLREALGGFGRQLVEYSSYCLLLPAMLRLLDDAEAGARAQTEGLLVLQPHCTCAPTPPRRTWSRSSRSSRC